MSDVNHSYTPPLGYAFLTPVYDAAIGFLTREHLWRRRLVEQIGPRPGDRIVDVGCGTGTLALALESTCSEAEIIGIDPDRGALDQARLKAGADSRVQFIEGFFGEIALSWRPNKIVSSLVLHQVPLAGKKALLLAIAAAMATGGSFHLADYSRQRSLLMRVAFRLTVQMLDGRRDTQPNADGVLESLMRECGFQTEITAEIPTATGSISLYCAGIQPTLSPGC